MPPHPPPKVKKWGQVDEDMLYELIQNDVIDIDNLSIANIERI